MRRPSDASDSAASDVPGIARVPAATLERPSRRALLLSRRHFLVAAAAILAGCARAASSVAPPRRTPTPFALKRQATLFVDASVPAAIATQAASRLSGQAGLAGVTAVPAQTADLVLTFGALPPGYVATSVGASPLAALTHLRVPVDTVTADQARGLLAGSIPDWNAVGAGYSIPVHPVALDGMSLPAGWSLAAGAQRVANTTDMLTALRQQPGSIAVVPVELADWTVRNLGVDGIYAAQGRGNVAQSPLGTVPLRIGVSRALVAQGLSPAKLTAPLASLLASATPTFDMVVAGDIILGRGVNNKMVAYNDYTYPYKAVRDEFLTADWRVANLECTITDLVPIPTDPATFTFITKKRAVEGLTYAGIQTVTVANNHADNGGAESFLDMLQTLDANSITHCGGGKNLAEGRQPVIQTVKGTRVALLGYNEIAPGGPYASDGGAGVTPVDLTTLPQDIASARSQADLVIPYFHWGIEYTKDPTTTQQQAAHAAIDAGADMVLGSHPHWVQGIESYKGKLIIYCLGNFIFDQDWSVPTQEGLMLHLYWRGTQLAGIRFVPYTIRDRCQPNILPLSAARDTFDRMWTGTDLLASGQNGPEYEP